MSIEIKEIKAHETWDMRHRVMWPERNIDYVKLPKDKEGFHYGLFSKGFMVSIVSLFIENGQAQFRKLATEETEQGRGYGGQLLNHVIKMAQSKKANRIWCNARVNKTGFYEKVGLQKTNETYSKGGIDFLILERWF
ncbi:MAG: putative GNAT family N-acyltransferase [Arcticibacterium sp.]|jgi:predicted GNAT family N-acyltransferase